MAPGNRCGDQTVAFYKHEQQNSSTNNDSNAITRGVKMNERLNPGMEGAQRSSKRK